MKQSACQSVLTPTLRTLRGDTLIWKMESNHLGISLPSQLVAGRSRNVVRCQVQLKPPESRASDGRGETGVKKDEERGICETPRRKKRRRSFQIQSAHLSEFIGRELQAALGRQVVYLCKIVSSSCRRRAESLLVSSCCADTVHLKCWERALCDVTKERSPQPPVRSPTHSTTWSNPNSTGGL